MPGYGYGKPAMKTTKKKKTKPKKKGDHRR